MRFSRNDHRGVTYVRQVIENLEPAMDLPGGVYNFGSGNAEDMVCTARQFAETLGITVKIDGRKLGAEPCDGRCKTGAFRHPVRLPRSRGHPVLFKRITGFRTL